MPPAQRTRTNHDSMLWYFLSRDTHQKLREELDLDLLDTEEASKIGRPRDNPNPRPSETKACMQGDAP
jgi:hypothetical protein